MADYITTDADLLAGDYITTTDYERLTLPEWRQAPGAAGPWTPRHTRAWTEVKSRLLALHDPIEEADVTSTTALVHPTLLLVVYLAFRRGQDQRRTDAAHDDFIQAWGRVNIPALTSSTGAAQWSRTIPLYRS